MIFQQGDIVHVSLNDELPDPNHELPADGWEAIVVGTDGDGEIEVAWLNRFITHSDPRNKPIRETWDDRTVVIQPGYDARVKLLRRATYETVEVGG